MQPIEPPPSSSSPSRPPRRALLIGCIAFVSVLCLVLAVLGARTVLRSPAFASFRDNAKFVAAEMPNVNSLRNQLLLDYPAQDVGVQVNWRQMVGSPDTVFGIAVTFQNPTFDVPSDNDERKELAHKIASEVAHTYPQVDRFDSISITFAKVRGIGITLSTALTYVFSVAELVE